MTVLLSPFVTASSVSSDYHLHLHHIYYLQICIGGEVPASYFQDPHEVEKLVLHGKRLQVRRAGKYEHRIDVNRPATEIR